MPVTIRNTRRDTKVVFSSRDMKGDSVEWAPAGDQNGEDVQQVPDSFVQGAPFLRAVGLGILVVESDDTAMMEAIAKQAKRYQRDTKSANDVIAALVDNGRNGREIVISEEAIDQHIAALSKSQQSDMSNIQGPADSVLVGDRTSPVLEDDHQ